jgi:hypothetical protein
MANSERGEVTLRVGDRDYVLVFDFEAYCQAEELMSTDGHIVSIREIFLGAASESLRYVRALMYGVTRSHQPHMTAKDVGQLIVDAGGPKALLATIRRLRKVSEPEGKKNRPPKARRPKNKAGARTTSTRAASASRPATSGG